ncbi:MAG: PhoH family protein [Phycisphaerales bacterium]|nr:PhoH family protein [Phycisphaerales bacterium]
MGNGGSAAGRKGSGSRSGSGGAAGNDGGGGVQRVRRSDVPGKAPPIEHSANTSAQAAAAQPRGDVVIETGVRSGRKTGAGARVRHFVVDTNVLLHDPNALFVFQEHEVIIPLVVVEELDRFKRDEGDRGRNARECIRHLDRLRRLGRLADGVSWGEAQETNGGDKPITPLPSQKTGRIRIDVGEYARPQMIREDTADNRIIACALGNAERIKGLGGAAGSAEVVFVTKDLNARIKADALGLETEDFENKKVDAERLYTGSMTIDVAGELIDELYRDRLLPLDRVEEQLRYTDGDGTVRRRTVYANQFVQMRDVEDENHTGLARRLADTDHLIPVTGPRKPTFGILPRNLQQTMALDLLMDEEVRMVTLLGSAGTGKTLMAVAAGMAKVFNEERYDKLLVARPIMPMGRDIGYLPGTKDDKLGAWMQPIFDNVGYLLSTRSGPMQQAESQTTEQRITKLVDSGKLVMEPLTYIRGRSIPHQFMIVDEAQNLTPHEVKTIASRIGEGTKLVLTGDINQIDNPYLDRASNGLSYAIERMKGLRIVGHVTMTKSERSELASLAASLL